MQQTSNLTSEGSNPEFRTSRVFEAPRRLVFEAWTKAEYLSRWFTPAPLTTPSCELDFRPGGVFRLVMQMPDGTQHPMDARFTEIVPEERIVFVATIERDLEVHTTVTFSEHSGKTTLNVHQTYSRQSESVRGAPLGWAATLDQLTEFIRSRM